MRPGACSNTAEYPIALSRLSSLADMGLQQMRAPQAAWKTMQYSSTCAPHRHCSRALPDTVAPNALARQSHSLLTGSRWTCSSLQHRSRHGRCSAGSRPVVPNMPFPGDDQGSTIYSALSGLETAAEDLIAKAEEATSKATGSSTPRQGGAESQNGVPPEGPERNGPLPHRWIVVGAMALAFVLCNMDKVGPLPH